MNKNEIDIFMPHEEFLAHYGVLGMKWGIRKDRVKKAFAEKKEFNEKHQNTKAISSNPTTTDTDLYWYGKKGVARIEKRIAKGTKPKTARMIEFGQSSVKGSAAGFLAMDLLVFNGRLTGKLAGKALGGVGYAAGYAFAAYGKAMAPKALKLVGPTANVVKLGKNAWSIVG